MGSDASDVEVIVGKFAKAIVEERLDDACGLLDDDFVVYEAGGLPYSGEYHGPAGFFELLGKMNEASELTLGDSVEEERCWPDRDTSQIPSNNGFPAASDTRALSWAGPGNSSVAANGTFHDSSKRGKALDHHPLRSCDFG